MMRAVGRIVLLVLACVAGLACAELLSRLPAFRSAAGNLFGRGELVAIVDGAGVYESDLPGSSNDPRGPAIAANLMRAASDEEVDEEEIERELNLLRAQFPNENAFAQTLEASGLSDATLRDAVAANLRGRQWLEKQIPPQLNVSEAESRKFYDANAARFAQPQRYRASHVFLAAPEGTAPEIVEAKQSAIQGIAMRILAGEDFATVAAEASEDEATKNRGGDLAPFAASRMAAEFITELEKLQVGEISPPIRSPLGFHVAQLTNVWAPRQLTFEEARAEIVAELLNQQRAAAVTALRDRLSKGPQLEPAR